jgi:hypothetical protein
LDDGYLFNFRARYNILGQIPLGRQQFKSGSMSLVLSNEVFINAGKEVVYNTFDQNRAFAGFALHINSHDNLQAVI